MRRSLACSVVWLGLPAVLAAQSITVGASRWLNSPHVTEYRAGIGGFGKGPVRLVYSAQYLKQSGSSKAHWYGVGGDLIVRPLSSAQPYLPPQYGPCTHT